MKYEPDGTVRVEVTPDEIAIANLIGRERQRKARERGTRDGHSSGEGDADCDDDIRGVLGELALAKALNVYANLLTEPDRMLGDVAGADVRATKHFPGKLPFRRGDSAEHSKPGKGKEQMPFVLALDRRPVPLIIIAGWLYGHEIKRPEHIQHDWRVPTWAVSSHLLRRMDGLWSYAQDEVGALGRLLLEREGLLR